MIKNIKFSEIDSDENFNKVIQVEIYPLVHIYLYTYLSICLSIYTYKYHTCNHLSIYQHVCISTNIQYPFIHQSIYLFIHPPIQPIFHQSIHPSLSIFYISIRPFTFNLFIHPSFDPSNQQYIHLSINLGLQDGRCRWGWICNSG